MKIGLLTDTSLSKFRINTLKPILEDDLFEVKVAIIDNRPKKSRRQKLLKNLRRGRGGYIFIMAFQSIFKKNDDSVNTKTFCKNNRIEVIECDNPYALQTLNDISRYELDILLFVGGFGIIKEPLITLTPLGILSYHHGNMRKYRGMPPALWELYNGESEMGVTVQLLAAGLDCGIPVEELTIKILYNDTLEKLEERLYNESERMLYNALKKLSNNDFVPKKIERFGKLYTLPNLYQWIYLNLKIYYRVLMSFLLSKTSVIQ